MQTSLTSLMLLQRSGQYFLPSGRKEQQSSRITKRKSCSPALSTSGISWKERILNLQLLREILNDLNCPDMTLVDDLCSGFKLTGWLPKSGVFPGRIRHLEYDVQTLKVLAKGLNKSAFAQVQNTEVDEVAESTWATTLEGERLGWIWRDPVQHLDGKVVAKRFGLQQKYKIRVIDDCSVCGLNAACGIKERFKIHVIDEMCAYVAWVFSKQKRGLCHKIVGKTFDWKSAYPQFCICKEDRDLDRIMVFDTDHECSALWCCRFSCRVPTCELGIAFCRGRGTPFGLDCILWRFHHCYITPT